MAFGLNCVLDGVGCGVKCVLHMIRYYGAVIAELYHWLNDWTVS